MAGDRRRPAKSAPALAGIGGDRDGGDHLRNGAQQKDAEGVAQARPEIGLREHGREVVEADEVALATDQVPLVHRNPGRVHQGEQADDREENEERRDIEVRGELHIPVAEALVEGNATNAAGIGGCGGMAAITSL